ncbi:MAG: ABC transporter ATP-binding protein [Candidatus Eisenbacteria bacterium]|jgi:ABC-2 type transport system ATP-binding protein|nr:ABC transporter ATP-binding protein [Candidatus Eisenbacteria bacterium]
MPSTSEPRSHAEAAVEVRGLAKRFGEVEAVAGIDFEVGEGEFFGFLGPNGAGKTTTINMLTGLARPDQGVIRIAGIDCSRNPKAAQHLMGVVPDESNLWPELDGFENLCFCGALYGMARRSREKRARELLETVGLADAARRRFGGYSKGMKRRLTIAAGIIHLPRILFLDEPTTGIDVASARHIRRVIADLNAGGTTIFLTTHYIEEAERLCGRIAFIVEGRLVRVDSLANLVRDVQDRRVVQLALGRDPAEMLGPLRQTFPGIEFEPVTGDALRAHTAHTLPLAPLIRFFEERGVDVTEANVIRPSLEEVFVCITGVALDRMRKEKEQSKRDGGVT